MKPGAYVGRFAPSPTGALHFGSLVAAVASFLDARSCHGIWLVRIEDIDPPREVPGAADAILRTLENHGLTWDAEVTYQSERTDRYEAAIGHLQNLGRIFECSCSRLQLQSYAIYPGTCRRKTPEKHTPTAIRLIVDGITARFNDLVQGNQAAIMQDVVGDFVIRRKDALFSYQLAVAVDDYEQGISRIVRGADLLDSSFRQIAIMQLLGAKQPEYAHIPIITHAQGKKLSKQTGATALQSSQASSNLNRALTCLGHPPPEPLSHAPPEVMLDWAIANWQLSNVPKCSTWPIVFKQRNGKP